MKNSKRVIPGDWIRWDDHHYMTLEVLVLEVVSADFHSDIRKWAYTVNVLLTSGKVQITHIWDPCVIIDHATISALLVCTQAPVPPMPSTRT